MKLQLLDKFLSSALLEQFLYYRYRARQKQWTVFEVLHHGAVQRSAEYIQRYLPETLLFPSREHLWKYAVTLLSENTRVIELGVYKGYSINRIAAYSIGKGIDVWGFDTFEGLTENWFGTRFHGGAYSNSGVVPKTHKNVVIQQGCISETLPLFLKSNDRSISLIHMDLDTSETTSRALEELSEVITRSAYIIFDQYHGYPAYEVGEQAAWKKYAENNNVSWRYLAFSNQQALIHVSAKD